MPRIIPQGWLDSAEMMGIVCHWTAGGHDASEVDKEHYHIIIEGDGRLVRGDHSIADNISARDGDYAPYRASQHAHDRR